MPAGRAGLPVVLLDDLRMRRAPLLWARLDTSETELNRLRDDLIDAVHAEVSSGRADRFDRRRLLAIKRDLHNRRPISAVPDFPALDTRLVHDLDRLVAAERRHGCVRVEFERTVTQEWSACQQVLRSWLADNRLLGGLSVSDPDVARQAMAAIAPSADSVPSRRQLRRLAAVTNYLLRAATRPTPFSTFGAVGLVDWRSPPLDSDPRWTTSHPDRVRTGLNLGLVRSFIAEETGYVGRTTMPLTATPWRTVDHGTLIFASTIEPGRQSGWYAADGRDVERVLEHLGDAPDSVELTHRLDGGHPDGAPWGPRVDAMIQAGFLNAQLPGGDPTAQGIRAIGNTVEALTGSPSVLHHIAELLEAFSTADVQARLSLHTEMAAALGCPDQGRGLVYEDVLLDGPTAAPTSGAELLDIVQPALDLAHSSLTDVPHMLMCKAFLDRYGLDGRCDDVGGFLTGLWRDGSMLDRMRYTVTAPAWLTSPLVDTAVTQGTFEVECDRSIFTQLPKSADRCAVSLFFRLWSAPGADDRPSGVLVAIDDAQSGRDKYLSRFLAEDDMSADALRDVRQSLAAQTPVPVEVRATGDHNFQLHPSMCPYTLAIGDPMEPRSGTIPLADLSLSFDTEARELILTSRALGRRVEPVHLGFLRDDNLPPPVALLMALSTRHRDDTVSERVGIHRVLDELCLAAAEPLPAFRPRLTVGRLVLERARWAIPAHEVRQLPLSQPTVEYVDAALRWAADRGLPDRCTAQVWIRLADGRCMLSTPAYLDWHTPCALAVLRSLSNRGTEAATGDPGWLILRELMPSQAESVTVLDGEPHVSQWMAQFRLGG